ncbi:hypothetical protein F2Q68_00042504 [Brassica cretica]|uniref:Uncharacterized protein n=1 Tax=Brassica cretica TaxID=69181 RepID=A0A8S9MGN7_BRACR|nr:hypothetical protein F2Q68_00042504 [Brassica cretica]
MPSQLAFCLNNGGFFGCGCQNSSTMTITPVIPPDTSDLRYRDFIDKNLPLRRAPVIESLVLKSRNPQLFRPENIKLWVGIAVSRCVRELTVSICYDSIDNKPFVPLPSSLYTCCNSLTALKLKGESIFV